MTWFAEHWLRLIFVAAYLAMLAHHSWSVRRHTKSLADYLIAGRSLGGWVVALSFYATFVSTNTFVGQAGKSWDVGLIWYIQAFVFGLLCYVAWYLVAPRFVAAAREYGSLTVADFLGFHYRSSRVRRAAAVVICGGSVLYLVAVYRGSALALEQFLGIPYESAAWAIFAVVTLYTLAGGFRSVVLTDAVQGALMAVGSVAIVVVVVMRGGGLASILENIREQDPALVSWRGNLAPMAIFGLAFAGGMKLLVDPRQLSRLYGLRDDQALRRARMVAPLLIFVTYLCLLPIGALAHALIPADAIDDSDRVMPYLLGTAKIFGPTLSSFFLLVLLSAAMSSLDSVLLVAASSASRDLFGSHQAEGRIAVTRAWVVLISIVSMLVALRPPGGIVEVTALSGSLYAACFLPTLVVGLYWKRRSAPGALACILVGGATVALWYLARKRGWTSWHEVYAGVVAALAVYALVSVVDRKRTPKRTVVP